VATDEIETCALCHARRSAIAEPYVHGRPLLDSHRPALLDEGLYSADGQIEGEVYEYGSFLQSRMYRRGVTCADCHEPHGLGLRAEGNALCARCHASTRFDAPSHHRHRGGARCVDCHMPQRTYMLVDPRRDHSLRVPRPDLTLKIGAPNACNACHADRTAGWAAEAAARWYGPARPAAPHYGVALYAGRAGAPGAGEALVALAADAETPGIVRATALSLLARYPDAARRVSPAASADPDPLVRLAAVSALEALPPDERAAPASPRLRDNIRAVRSEAARVLASLLAGSTAAASTRRSTSIGRRSSSIPTGRKPA
jgi:predicted CXXCH cytochrome family protein